MASTSVSPTNVGGWWWWLVVVAATLKNFTSVSLLSWAHSPPPISELCLIVWPDPDPGPVITNYILNLQIAIDIYKVFALLSGFNAKYKKSGKKFSAQETDTVYLAWVTYQTLLLYLPFQSIWQLIGVEAWKSSECLRRKMWMHFVFFPCLVLGLAGTKF